MSCANSITLKTNKEKDGHALSQYVSGLFENVDSKYNKFYDAQIEVESKTFYCHKIILAAHSKYFSDLPYWSEIEKPLTITSDQFRDVLKFMYTGEVQSNTDDIESLLSAADILGVGDLTKVCSQFLQGDVVVDDNPSGKVNPKWMSYWPLANKYQLKTLAQKCQTQAMDALSLAQEIIGISEDMMRVIMINIDVSSEVEICELLMKWLQVRKEAGHEVHPDKLLPLIKWPDITIDYVNTVLLQNTTLLADKTSLDFLTKVTTYLKSGVQFEGMQTSSRSSSGLENNLLTILTEFNNGKFIPKEVCCISLQYLNKIKTLTSVPSEIKYVSTATTCNNNVYITGGMQHGFGIFYFETWIWNESLPWIKRPNQIALRYRTDNCLAVVDSKLYVLGGYDHNNKVTLTTIECFDTITEKWNPGTIIGRSHNYLMPGYAVSHAACVTYNNLIYVFGGADTNRKPVAYVQTYDPVQGINKLMDRPMPRAQSHMRAVLWETYAILLGRCTCFVYDFEKLKWQENEQFKTDVDFFAVGLANSTVYVAGGIYKSNMQNKAIPICTDEVKSVHVWDIINGKKHAAWKHHAKLPKPAMIDAFVNVSLKLNKAD